MSVTYGARLRSTTTSHARSSAEQRHQRSGIRPAPLSLRPGGRYGLLMRMLIFGLGYSARAIAARVVARGGACVGTTRAGEGGAIAFADQARVLAELRDATHILSSVPPDRDGVDPVLAHYGDAVAVAPAHWVGYLSSTGVYGDAQGAWVDESAPMKGRRAGRNAADLAWGALRNDVRRFRLPGIYGPGRSVLDRLQEGKAHRVDLPDQIFSRVHVDDIAGAVVASFAVDAVGAFNIADDLPASQNDVVAEGVRLLGLQLPPLIMPDDPALSPMARAFYAENRRVANGRAQRLLDWTPQYATYRQGLAAIMAGSRS